MSRRAHTKSRHGCRDCKRRHIKCDETQPACSNCKNARIPCTYVKFTPASTTSPSAGAPPTPPSEVGSPQNSKSSSSSPPTLQLDHLHLLSHFLLEAGPSSGMGVFHYDQEVTRLFMSNATSTPYLMYEVLAFSALHLSRSSNVSQAKHYRDEAVRLQTQALTVFKDPETADNRENVPMLLFASLLSSHMLADIVQPNSRAAEDLLDKFIDYLNVHRGVRAIAGRDWTYIQSSELAPFINRASAELNVEITSQTEFLNHLWKLLEHDDLGASSRAALDDAIRNLHLVAAAEKNYQRLKARNSEELEFPYAYTQRSMLFIWPVLITADFSTLLVRRNPEALIILAHYAALLHPYSDVWIVGDAGRLLIRPIAKQLGSFWASWLDWPISVLGPVT